MHFILDLFPIRHCTAVTENDLQRASCARRGATW